MKIFKKRISKGFIYKAVCRTGPATPGLLVVYLRLGKSIDFKFNSLYRRAKIRIMYILAKFSNGSFKPNILENMKVHQSLYRKVYPRPNTDSWP